MMKEAIVDLLGIYVTIFFYFFLGLENNNYNMYIYIHMDGEHGQQKETNYQNCDFELMTFLYVIRHED